jgi:hypothetical protein
MLKAVSHLVDAYIHEVGLYGALQGQCLSLTRVEILFDCLNCMRNYVSIVLPLSVEQMEGWACFDWRQLDYVTKLATKVVLTIDSTAGNEDSVARIAKLDALVEHFCDKARSLHAMTNTPRGQYHCFPNLLMEWQNIRSWCRAAMDRAAARGTQTYATRSQDGSVPSEQMCRSMDISQVQGHNWMGFGGMENWADSWD